MSDTKDPEDPEFGDYDPDDAVTEGDEDEDGED
jgi:hypothetical protein